MLKKVSLLLGLLVLPLQMDAGRGERNFSGPRRGGKQSRRVSDMSRVSDQNQVNNDPSAPSSSSSSSSSSLVTPDLPAQGALQENSTIPSPAPVPAVLSTEKTSAKLTTDLFQEVSLDLSVAAPSASGEVSVGSKTILDVILAPQLIDMIPNSGAPVKSDGESFEDVDISDDLVSALLAAPEQQDSAIGATPSALPVTAPSAVDVASIVPVPVAGEMPMQRPVVEPTPADNETLFGGIFDVSQVLTELAHTPREATPSVETNFTLVSSVGESDEETLINSEGQEGPNVDALGQAIADFAAEQSVTEVLPGVLAEPSAPATSTVAPTTSTKERVLTAADDAILQASLLGTEPQVARLQPTSTSAVNKGPLPATPSQKPVTANAQKPGVWSQWLARIARPNKYWTVITAIVVGASGLKIGSVVATRSKASAKEKQKKEQEEIDEHYAKLLEGLGAQIEAEEFDGENIV